eukprot:gene14188-16728_t
MSTNIDLLELVSACLELAEQSGDIIRNIFKSGELGTKYKAEDDPVTIADTTVQEHIIRGLRSRWAKLNIVGEESCDAEPGQEKPDVSRLQQYADALAKTKFAGGVPLEDIIIFIDPLDATREFTRGNVECVMTLIGVSMGGVPIAGVIHQPFVDAKGYPTTKEQWCGRSVWAMPGMPVIGLASKRAADDEGKVLLVTSASHSDAKVDAAIVKIQPDRVIRTGGAGYKSLMVIERLADVYVFPTVGSKLWDICAPHAILLAVGGRLTDPSGKDIIYSDNQQLIENKQGIVITVGDHDRYIQLLNN